ncbi:MAG: alpha/beta hydrolase [Bacteroidota bacterium]|nr:alpha/beta hydrolase [Bacteroidota bacterium]
MNPVIYCISGLGADEKIFRNLQLGRYELKHIPWLRPHKKEKIDEYAGRMASAIRHDSPVLIGVSFGGMISIEIARQIPLKKLIIISSIKSTHELPQWMRVAGSLYLDKLMPIRPYKFTEKIGNDRLGVSTEEERDLVKGYREKTDPVYLEWAVHQVLNWKNNWQPESIIHIHGDKDKIFPLRNLRVQHIIRGGTHLMLYNRAEEISKLILQELGK